MKVAMIGSRGFNSGYGGIETMLNEVCPRLVNLGCTVDVFSRRDVPIKSGLPGLRAIPVRSIGGKHFENLSRSAFATIKALGRYDVVHFHAIGPGILSVLTRCRGQRSVVTVQGLDYNRDKWGTFARTSLRLAERTAVGCATQITAAAPGLKRYLDRAYGCDATFIPNGFKMQTRKPAGPGLAGLGVTAGYILFASRLTPEKGIEELIKVYNLLPTTRRLVVAGETRITTAAERAWHAKIHQMADPTKITFVGRQSVDVLAELFSNAYLHVLPSHLEGWSMSLTEALGYRIPSVASDIDANRDVMGKYGFYFKVGDLADLQQTLMRLLAEPEEVAAMAKSLGSVHLADWDEVASDYHRVYESVVACNTLRKFKEH
jgi:glycosyltransferase involved in cell wall biosynthesis